jgi:hypothetical protein
MCWGPWIEFSRNALIDERSFPSYDRTSVAGSGFGPPESGYDRLFILLRMITPPATASMSTSAIIRTGFEFIERQLGMKSYQALHHGTEEVRDVFLSQRSPPLKNPVFVKKAGTIMKEGRGLKKRWRFFIISCSQPIFSR